MKAYRWFCTMAVLGLMSASVTVAGPAMATQPPLPGGPPLVSCATDPDPVACLVECLLGDPTPEGVLVCAVSCWVVEHNLTLHHEVSVTPSGSGWGSDTESQTSGFYRLVAHSEVDGTWTYRFTGFMPCAGSPVDLTCRLPDETPLESCPGPTG